MTPTRKANQDTSRVQDGNNTRLFGAGGSPPNGPQLTIHLTPEELNKIITDAVKMAMAKKTPTHHSSHPEQQREQPQEEERREGERESNAGSKSPTVAEELEELRKKVKVLEGQVGSKDNVQVVKGCQFSDIIVREPLPGHFKSAKIKDYDGSSDPEEHLARSENMAMLYCYGDQIKCKVFLTTFVDSAQRWFEGLAPQSIHCFEDFQKVFLHQFSSSKKYKKTAFSLFEVKQGQDETLRAYIKRFNRVALDVPACAPETKTTAFMQGLWEGDFFRSLTKKLPENFENLLSQAEKYINMEEAQNQKREALKRSRGDRVVKPEERAHKKSGPRHFSHVPLRIARDREIQECSSDIASLPNPMGRASRPEKKGFCTLHKECSHSTHECRTLRKGSSKRPMPVSHPPRDKSRQPPWLPRRPGQDTPHKSSYIPSGSGRAEGSSREERSRQVERKDPSPSRGIIKMISGGSTDGDSNRARKARSRRECLEVDGNRRDEPARVANYDVLRVFVDNGSSVNVIFKEALAQMDLHEYQLEAVETVLLVFAGQAVYPEGEITLPLTLSTGDLRKTVMTVFTVVDAPSSYNIILGRSAMNEIRALASTYHQKIKFPSSRTGRGGQGRSTLFSEELTGISPQVAEHKLNILPGSRAVKQKKRHFGPEKDKIIEEQVGELLRAGHIREVQFPTWPSNVGYHQIPLALGDQDKANFITSGGTFCNVVMPFGLKNAGATYQRLMNLVFQKQIGRNIEVYVDDILIKTREVSHFVDDLAETFTTLKQYGIKLNPSKCVFGVRSGKFLGFLVTDRGIEVNPEKIKAIMDMPSPQSVRDVQKLTGRIAALSSFISRSAHRSYPFFQAFQDLKKHLAELPILAKPEPGEKLWVYLSATEFAVSSVLVREEGANQKPIYYVSHALRGAELKYSELERIALALVMTARKLRPFLSHPIMVLTNSPLGRIMTHAEVSGRMVKWTVELGEYDIEYKPRAAIKAQALIDFLTEMIQPVEEEVWRVFVDGASNLSGCGVGVVLVSPSEEKIKLALRIDSRVTNNEA
ncbi:uncharacterized protein LOC142525845 [Primulina tabacum]|uniref:uncharacterized protein LOC142525845 n=1 Tax=Primulina tabacum TaxID=48773 RepID=UPI003F59EBCF